MSEIITGIEAEEYLQKRVGDTPHITVAFIISKKQIKPTSIKVDRDFIRKYWRVEKNAKNAKFVTMKDRKVRTLKKMLGDLLNGHTSSRKEY
jgi:hypothetical protein